MRIAISGASGYLGHQLAAALAERGHTVLALGRSGDRLAALNGMAEVMEVDLLSPPQDLFQRLGRPDLLCHLAWEALVDYRHPCHVEQQLPAHARLLRDLVVAGLPRVLVTGTCLEYGMQCGALDETRPTDPVTAYGLAKDTLRRQLQLLQREHPFELTWLRLFYLHAADQPRNALYAQLQRAANAGQPRFAMSSGEQLRDFLAVNQVVQWMADLAGSGHGFGVLNLCSGQPVSVRSQVERWIADAGWTIEPELGVYPQPSYEPLAFWGDSRRLQQALGQCPSLASRSFP